jgi:hypothetical protein
MNIKSYLRGIGAGIIVAALVMGVSNSRESRPVEEIDNSTLIENSAELSISSDDEISGNDVSPNDIVKEDSVSANTETEESFDSSMNEEQAKDDISGSDSDKENDSEKTHINPMPEGEDGYADNGETVTLTIVRGDSSVSVSRRLYEAGLVESAVEFDKYLCKEGYDKYICVGTFEIAPDADFETIAKIITKKN